MKRWIHAASAGLIWLGAVTGARADAAWDAVLARARGETVYWNAWGGDERTNGFIAWVGDQMRQRYGVEVRQVKLTDTGEAVARVVAEKSAGRDADGAVDMIWINGPNFLSMKQKGLLYGPFVDRMPNAALHRHRRQALQRHRLHRAGRGLRVAVAARAIRVHLRFGACPRAAAFARRARRLGQGASGALHPSRPQGLHGRELPQTGADRSRAGSRTSAAAGRRRRLRRRRPRRCGPGTTRSAPRSGARASSSPPTRPALIQAAQRRRGRFRDGVRSGRGGGRGRGGAAAGERARHDASPTERSATPASSPYPTIRRTRTRAMVVADFLLDPATQAHAQDITRARRLQRARSCQAHAGTAQAVRRSADFARRCRRAPTSARCCSSRIRPG